MQIFNNEITCYVGETFNLNIQLKNKNGDPYILFREQKEDSTYYPSYIVLSIAPTVYTDKDVYRLYVRIDNTDIPQFKYTNIIDSSLLDSGDDAVATVSTGGVICFGVYEAADYVFRLSDGTLVYFVEPTVGTILKNGIPYSAPTLQFAFTRELTTQLGVQTYVYDLRYIIAQEENEDFSKIDIRYKTILLSPTKFKVLYPVTEIGGDNINGN